MTSPRDGREATWRGSRDVIPLSERRTYLLCGAVASAAFLLMVYYSSVSSLWFDDLAQIFMTRGVRSVSELIANNLDGDNMPPLYHFFTALWLRISPYGTAWLRLPSEIAVAIGIFLCGLAGYRLGGSATGLFACFFAATSGPLILDCAYAFRPYGFYFLFSAFAMYSHIVRVDHLGKETRTGIVRYGIALTLLVYTHYFGILLCAALFVGDLVLWVKRQVKASCFLSYGLAGIAFLPWAIAALPHLAETARRFWPEPPTARSVPYTVMHLFGERLFPFAVAVVASMIVHSISHVRGGQMFSKVHRAWLLMLWAMLFVIGITYVYSAHVNPGGSVYVDRYFYCLLPSVFLLLAWGADQLSRAIVSIPARAVRTLPVLLAAATALFLAYDVYHNTVGRSRSRPLQQYEEAAAWLCDRSDIHDPGILVVSTWPRERLDLNAGWDYYLTHDGARPGIARISSSDLTEARIKDATVIYLFKAHRDMAGERYRILDAGFECAAEYPEVSMRVYARRGKRLDAREFATRRQCVGKT